MDIQVCNHRLPVKNDWRQQTLLIWSCWNKALGNVEQHVIQRREGKPWNKRKSQHFISKPFPVMQWTLHIDQTVVIRGLRVYFSFKCLLPITFTTIHLALAFSTTDAKITPSKKKSRLDIPQPTTQGREAASVCPWLKELIWPICAIFGITSPFLVLN